MPIPTVITDLSATAASNYPAGTDAPSVLDDVQRVHASFIRNLLDGLISNIYTAYTTAGTSTAYTLTPSPAITAYVAGQSFFVTFHAAAGTSPTLQISGLASPPLLYKLRPDGSYALIEAGDIPINHRSRVTLLSGVAAWVETIPRSGVVIDRAYAEYTSNADITTLIPGDDTIPQNTEGTQILSVSLTPKSVTSRIRLRFSGEFSSSAATSAAAAVFSSASANALRATLATMTTTGYALPLVLEHEYVPGVTTALTFSVRVGPITAGTIRMNGSTTARFFGGAMACTLVVEELA